MKRVDDLAARWPHEDLSGDVAAVMFSTAGAEAALDFMKKAGHVEDTTTAFLLLAVGRNDESLAIMRRIAPEMFADTLPITLYPRQIPRAALVGANLVRAGSFAQGQTLLEKVAQTYADLPINPAIDDGSFWDVRAYAAAKESEQAFAALSRAVDRGALLDITDLDNDPMLVDLRRDPRYEKTLAPARARAEAQIEAAKAAGLL